MSEGIFKIPQPSNEKVLQYALGSEERQILQRTLKRFRNEEHHCYSIIDGVEVKEGVKKRIFPPHELKHTLGYYYEGGKELVYDAIDAALEAKASWENMPWQARAAIFLKAADLLAGPYRQKINAATMLCQSKNAHQAEIDAACELIDFFRFNVDFMKQMYEIQPNSSAGLWNRTDWRPLEGFVVAITPFNFTSIAGNLPTAPAMLGNTVVWKPSNWQIYSATILMEVLNKAGLPNGVINMIITSGSDCADVVLDHPELVGIHFTGSTAVFQQLWERAGKNIHKYKSYPRLVGETGGKDFIVAHPSAHCEVLATAIVRGAFEYQGQKCSAASRAYIPASLWPQLKECITCTLNTLKTGPPEDFGNYINAVIHEKAFNKLTQVIDRAQTDNEVEIIAGGTYDNSQGYFITPTVLLTSDPDYYTMREELFGPIITLYIYPDEEFEAILERCDTTSEYALTGALFARDRDAIQCALDKLRYAAGNFYINDKPTGAVVGQQPFGGSRSSGTNDKAGSILNLLRWVSPRSVKENFNPPTEYGYPFLNNET